MIYLIRGKNTKKLNDHYTSNQLPQLFCPAPFWFTLTFSKEQTEKQQKWKKQDKF